jgi:hypothetical protein
MTRMTLLGFKWAHTNDSPLIQFNAKQSLYLQPLSVSQHIMLTTRAMGDDQNNIHGAAIDGHEQHPRAVALRWAECFFCQEVSRLLTCGLSWYQVAAVSALDAGPSLLPLHVASSWCPLERLSSELQWSVPQLNAICRRVQGKHAAAAHDTNLCAPNSLRLNCFKKNMTIPMCYSKTTSNRVLLEYNMGIELPSPISMQSAEATRSFLTSPSCHVPTSSKIRMT